MITHNRLNMLKKAVNALLPTLKDINYELIIWDNNSDEDTKNYLKGLPKDNRIKIVLHESNIGTNAKGRALELATGEFLIGVDDDVIEFPANWISEMITAYKRIPAMGYLSTNVVQDEITNGAKQPDHFYNDQHYDGGKIILQVGPAGGWCFMVSRYVYSTVGKFAQYKDRLFFMEDADYAWRAAYKGFKYGILKSVKVYHATGKTHNIEYSSVYETKMRDYLDNIESKPSFITNLKRWSNFRYQYYKVLHYVEQEINKE